MTCVILSAMVLDDTTIRQFLRRRLSKRYAYGLKEELRVVHNRAVADIVALGQVLHCFEIKGEGDSLSQLKNQVLHYNQAFDKVTVVVTARNRAQVEALIPSFWGVILAVLDKNGIKLKSIRAANKNPELEKYTILHSLWKPELARILDIGPHQDLTKVTRNALIAEVRRSFSNKRVLNLLFSEQISMRNLTQPLNVP